MRSEPEPDEKQETTIRLLSSRNPRQAQGSSQPVGLLNEKLLSLQENKS